MQEFVRSQGSGWEHAISYLDRVFDALRVVDAKVEPIEPTERHAIYLEQVRILARRIAELHLALASNDQIPAFKPEPISAQDLMLLQKRFSEASSAAFSALQVAQKNAAEPDASRLAALAARRGECIECFAALSQEPLTAMKTRIHGDLHLGQILVVQNDFHVIDFEGEPARTLAARRAKGSPLQDVAGMLRSFEYASWAALHKIADRDPDGLSRLLPHAEEWKRLVRSTFMDSYREAIAGCVSWPANAEEADRLLNLFLLDKVLYEIRYEAANRPSWLRIPLAGLAEILDGAAKIKERTLEPA
jgi:maltose alpha-D-glucosyltransferase / alpha-amylase